jgi:hypothetical protein
VRFIYWLRSVTPPFTITRFASCRFDFSSGLNLCAKQQTLLPAPQLNEMQKNTASKLLGLLMNRKLLGKSIPSILIKCYGLWLNRFYNYLIDFVDFFIPEVIKQHKLDSNLVFTFLRLLSNAFDFFL